MSRELDKEKIRRALRRGKRFAKKADELQEETDIQNIGRTQEYVREIIRELIHDGLPIGSLPNYGYWIIANKRELSEVIRNLQGRTKGIAGRAKQIKENYYRSKK